MNMSGAKQRSRENTRLMPACGLVIAARVFLLVYFFSREIFAFHILTLIQKNSIGFALTWTFYDKKDGKTMLIT